MAVQLSVKGKEGMKKLLLGSERIKKACVLNEIFN